MDPEEGKGSESPLRERLARIRQARDSATNTYKAAERGQPCLTPLEREKGSEKKPLTKTVDKGRV